MPALYDQLTEEQQLELREYIRLQVKQEASTTASITINSDGDRVLTDVHAQFQTNEVSEGDTVYFYNTTPESVAPVGSYEILEVVSETEIKILGNIVPLGVHAKYRVINTSGIQAKINELYANLASVLNGDKAEALKQEAINVPWYTRSTDVVLNYFLERSSLDGYRFVYPVDQSDLDAVTLVPQPALSPPFDEYGPLLYPFSYTGQAPDRRAGDAYTGLGTPSLLGSPDTSPLAIPADHTEPPDVSTIPLLSGELNALEQEDIFYSIHTPVFPSPGYSSTVSARLTSIKNAQDTALANQQTAIASLISYLDTELADLRERGVLSTGLYATLSVARARLTTALAQATYARTNPTDGLPAITTSALPTAARKAFVKTSPAGPRRNQILARVAQIWYDQAPWVQQRYTFLNRRVNPVDGSLTLLRLADASLNDVSASVAALLEERQTINYPIGVNP